MWGLHRLSQSVGSGGHDMKQVSLRGVFIAAALVLSACGSASGIDVAAKNMNVAGTDSIEIVGNGTWGWVGQMYRSSGPWLQIPVSDYTMTIDYAAGASHVQMTRTEPTQDDDDQTLAFGHEYFDLLKKYLDEYLSGTSAWNVMTHNPVVVRPDRVAERIAAVQSTPHGFIKLALENKAPFRETSHGGETNFTVGNQKFEGRFNAQGDLDLVRTWIDNNPVLGDMLVETHFQDYRTYGGVRFPGRITRFAGGHPILDLTITDVRANVPAAITVPEAVKNYQAPPIRVVGELLAPGVWFMRGGGYNSLLIEQADHLIVVESSSEEAEAQAVIAKAKEMVPGKPIRFIVNTHTHFDHSGGLRAYVAEGATVVTNAVNEEYYRKVWSNPRTINPDAMAKDNAVPKFQPVEDKYTLSDGKRSVDVYAMRGVHHAEAMLMIHLPAEKVISVGDVYMPYPDNVPLTDTQVQGAAELVENIERVGADVAIVATIHGNRVGSMEDLLIHAGRVPPKSAKAK